MSAGCDARGRRRADAAAVPICLPIVWCERVADGKVNTDLMVIVLGSVAGFIVTTMIVIIVCYRWAGVAVVGARRIAV